VGGVGLVAVRELFIYIYHCAVDYAIFIVSIFINSLSSFSFFFSCFISLSYVYVYIYVVFLKYNIMSNIYIHI
jgi:hypothetical protein